MSPLRSYGCRIGCRGAASTDSGWALGMRIEALHFGQFATRPALRGAHLMTTSHCGQLKRIMVCWSGNLTVRFSGRRELTFHPNALDYSEALQPFVRLFLRCRKFTTVLGQHFNVLGQHFKTIVTRSPQEDCMPMRLATWKANISHGRTSLIRSIKFQA